jgi:hypothetical protein
MPRRTSLDAVMEEALNELEGEFEASGGSSTKKNFYIWRVLLRRDFGGPEEPVEALSVSKSELRTPEDARFRHSAVVQMAYKTLKGKALGEILRSIVIAMVFARPALTLTS